MKPGKNKIKTAHIAASILIVMLISPEWRARAEGQPQRSAAVYFYADAAGTFTLSPPPANTGYYLSLSGTFTQHELLLKVQKKKSALAPRQASYRMSGRTEFNIKYVLKEGIGDYNVLIFGRKSANTEKYSGLCNFSISSNGTIPERSDMLYINDKVLAFVGSVMGKTVNSGECWDLAQEALDNAGADWVRPLNFGTLLAPVSDEIRPGDIIQFRSVRLTFKIPGGITKFEKLGNPDHTAIIYGVEGKKIYKLAHQNSDGRRYVVTTVIDLNCLTEGKYWIYRPVAGIIP
jgi:hypothetical protein